MKIDQLLDALGEIAPCFIKEAEEDVFPGRRSSFGLYRRKLVYFISAAACIGLVFFGARLGLFGNIAGRMEYTAQAPAEAEEAAAEEAAPTAEEAPAEEAAPTDEMAVEEVPAGETVPETPEAAESMATQGAEETAAGSAGDGKAEGALPETGVEAAEEERTMQSESFNEDVVEMKQDKAADILIAIDQVASIEITDGNTGKATTIADEKQMEEILALYAALQFGEDASLERRSGYSRCMRLMDENGNLLQTVTPYEDTVNIDGVMYSCDGNATSRKLLEELELFQ